MRRPTRCLQRGRHPTAARATHAATATEAIGTGSEASARAGARGGTAKIVEHATGSAARVKARSTATGGRNIRVLPGKAPGRRGIVTRLGGRLPANLRAAHRRGLSRGSTLAPMRCKQLAWIRWAHESHAPDTRTEAVRQQEGMMSGEEACEVAATTGTGMGASDRVTEDWSRSATTGVASGGATTRRDSNLTTSGRGTRRGLRSRTGWRRRCRRGIERRRHA